MTDTEVMNGAATDAFPDLGSKSPEKEKKPKANFKKNDKDAGQGKKPRRRPAEADVDVDTPLVKPALVERPDEAAHNDKITQLREKIDAEEKRVTAISDDIEKMKEAQGEGNVEMNAQRAMLRESRQKIRDTMAEREKIHEELKKAADRMKNHDKKAQALRKDNKSLDIGEIDRLIAQINEKLETSSMDLKAEKEQIREMKKLTESKAKVAEHEAEKEAASQARARHDELYAKKQEVIAKLNELRDQDKGIAGKMDAMRTGEGFEGGVNPTMRIKELTDDKSAVITGIKALREQIKEVNIAYKIKVAEHREYERALQAYERKAGRKEYLKRRAEQDERREQIKVEKKEWDARKKEEKRKMEERMRVVAAGFQLYISGLQLRTAETAFIEHFKTFGTVTDAFIVKDSETQLSRGFGFVTFETDEAAQNAVKEVHSKEIAGLSAPHSRLYVRRAEKSKMQKEWESRNLKAERGKKEAEANQSSSAVESGETLTANASAPAAGEDAKGGGSGKKWEATRTDWAKPADQEVVANVGPDEADV